MRSLNDDPVSGQTQSFFNGAYGSFYVHTTIRNTQPGTASLSPNPYDVTYKFNATMAVIILVLAGAFLAIGIFAFYMKKCVLSSADSDVLLLRRTTAAAAAARAESGSKGLDREVLDKFPIVQYSAAEDLEDGKKTTDCAVCLTEFQERESVRLLPTCNHSFHPECIDLWLTSHSTCPLCRISLVPVPQTQTVTETQTQTQAPVMEAIAVEESAEAFVAAEESLQANSEAAMAVRALSRSSESFRKAVQDVEMRQRSTALSVSFENGSSSKWMSKLMRSISMEGSRPSRGVPSDAAIAMEGKAAQESCQITIEARGEGCEDATEGSSKMVNAEGNLLSRTWNSALQHSISFRQFKGLPPLDRARPTNN